MLPLLLEGKCSYDIDDFDVETRSDEAAVATLLRARGADFDAVCTAADTARREQCGDVVSYVVNRNITVKDQAKLFTSSKSKADGRTNKSYHQTGKAVDVYAYVDGKASWEKEHLAIIAAAMLQASAQLGYELKWGGLWKSWQDFPHFEIRD